MKFNRRFNHYLLIFAVLSFSFVLFACGNGVEEGEAEQNGEESEQVEQPDEFVIARSGDANLLDPGHSWDGEDLDPIYHMFEGLVEFENDDLEIGPSLATEWEQSEDGLEWTFDLREEVTFHDGTDFNADAVVYSFERILDEEHPNHGVVQGGAPYMEYLMGGIIEEVTALDEHKVEFKLTQRFAPFLSYMAYYSQYIVSPDAAEEYGPEFPENPVGTGPFEFVNWEKDEYIELEVNEDYWGEQPEIDGLVFRVIPENSTRLMELQTGDVHAIKDIDPTQFDTIDQDDDLNMLEVPGANIFYAAFNTTREPFDDPQVRQALNKAINMDEIVEVIYEGMATRAINPLPPTVNFFDDTAGPYEYDPETAREMLADAGHEDGFELDLFVFTESRTYVTQPVEVAEIFAHNLEEVGIDVNLVANEWSSHESIMANEEHDIAFTGWYDIPNPSNFLKTMALEGGYTGYSPQDLIDLSNDALAYVDEEDQREAYQQLQHELHEAAPMIPIAHMNYTVGTRSDVQGIELDTIGTIWATDAYIE